MNTDERLTAIRQIAARVLRVPTLEARNSDSLDFHEIGVWQLRDALAAAYDAGFRAATKPVTDDTEPQPPKDNASDLSS